MKEKIRINEASAAPAKKAFIQAVSVNPYQPATLRKTTRGRMDRAEKTCPRVNIFLIYLPDYIIRNAAPGREAFSPLALYILN